MASFVKQLYDDLLCIRTYLVKIGPSRRQGDILIKKLNEANLIVEQYNNYLNSLSKVPRFNKNEDLLIKFHCDNFDKIYAEISNLCRPSEALDCTRITMEKFDLKVALTLLPVMTEDLSTVRQLIDGIDYYSSIIDDGSKGKLINFILKSRLTQGAKLKLRNNYDSVADLITDMKRMLLPQQSAEALQKQLLHCRQNDMSIDDYGKKLSELFVDLTISQSEDNAEKYNILKEINEKQAIRQFCDGLRNRRISTIVSAQRFKSLKDAVQAAIDENVSDTCKPPDIMTVRYNNNFKAPQVQFTRGASYHNRNRGRGPSHGYQASRGARQWVQQPRDQPGGAYRGRNPNRGKSYFNSNFRARRQVRGQVRTAASDPPLSQPSFRTSNQYLEAENEFFRV